MFKGTSASAGIGIGKVAIVEDVQLVIKKETVANPQTELERFKAALMGAGSGFGNQSRGEGG